MADKVHLEVEQSFRPGSEAERRENLRKALEQYVQQMLLATEALGGDDRENMV